MTTVTPPMALNQKSAKPPVITDAPADQNRREILQKKARDFEAAFIAEMLAHAGFEKALSGASGFGGETFSRMLVEDYAQTIADAGGFGLAEKIYDQLKDNVK